MAQKLWMKKPDAQPGEPGAEPEEIEVSGAQQISQRLNKGWRPCAATGEPAAGPTHLWMRKGDDAPEKVAADNPEEIGRKMAQGYLPCDPPGTAPAPAAEPTEGVGG